MRKEFTMRNIRKKLYTGVALVALLSVGTIHGMDAIAIAAKAAVDAVNQEQQRKYAAVDAVNQEQQRKYIESGVGMDLYGDGHNLESGDPIAKEYLKADAVGAKRLGYGFNNPYTLPDNAFYRTNRLYMEHVAVGNNQDNITLTAENFYYNVHPQDGSGESVQRDIYAHNDFIISADVRQTGLNLSNQPQQLSMYDGYRGVGWFDKYNFKQEAVASSDVDGNDTVLINAVRAKGLVPPVSFSPADRTERIYDLVRRITVDESYDISEYVGGYKERVAGVKHMSKELKGGKVSLTFKAEGDYIVPIFYFLNKRVLAGKRDDRLGISYYQCESRLMQQQKKLHA